MNLYKNEEGDLCLGVKFVSHRILSDVFQNSSKYLIAGFH